MTSDALKRSRAGVKGCFTRAVSRFTDEADGEADIAILEELYVDIKTHWEKLKENTCYHSQKTTRKMTSG